MNRPTFVFPVCCGSHHRLCEIGGGDIVACGVARFPQNIIRVDLVFCSECGSGNLEVCYTSKALGPHLCPTCVQSKVECGVAERMLRSPMADQPVA